MIDQELVNRIESDIDKHGSPRIDDVIDLMDSYKQLIKDSAEPHKKLSSERVFVVNGGDEE